MSESVDAEIEAIRNVLAALQPLSENARASVLEYVTKRLSIATVPTHLPAPETQHPPVSQLEKPHDAMHIKDFKEQKKRNGYDLELSRVRYLRVRVRGRAADAKPASVKIVGRETGGDPINATGCRGVQPRCREVLDGTAFRFGIRAGLVPSHGSS